MFRKKVMSKKPVFEPGASHISKDFCVAETKDGMEFILSLK